MCESYVQAYSKPWASAKRINSIIRLYGGSGRTVTPKVKGMAGERSYRAEIGAHNGVVPRFCRRGRRDAADPVRGQRPALALGRQPGPRSLRVVSRRDAHAARGLRVRAQAAALARPARRRTVVGLDGRDARSVLR